ncbi:MAG: MmcQ/YjbR family DNA-binding protein [Planctomycetota bacterium]|jgi:predicted DNA-binding protein (MmcQ/YjbR family)
MGAGPLVRLRSICRPLPEVRETLTFGNPTFQAGKKTFAVLDTYEGKRCIVFKAPGAVQRTLCRTGFYFPSPFGARHGWTGAWVRDDMDWAELEELLVGSYRLVALKRMLGELDSGS